MVLTDEETWMFFISEVGKDNEETIQSLVNKKDVLRMAYERYYELNESDLMREKLEAHEKYLMDQRSTEEELRNVGVIE